MNIKRKFKAGVLVGLCALISLVTAATVHASTAAKDISASKVADKIVKQFDKAQYITISGYFGNVKNNNYISTVAMNKNDNTVYKDSTIIGDTKMYYKGKKMYWYDISNKEWCYTKTAGQQSGINYSNMIQTSYSGNKVDGYKKFQGVKCLVLSTKSKGGTDIKYYLRAKDYKIMGAVSGTGAGKVTLIIELDTKVKVPSNIIKNAKKRDYYRCGRSDVKTGDVNVACYDYPFNVSDIKEQTVTSYSQMKEIIAGIENETVKNILNSYDKKYFKKNVLVIKNIEDNPLPLIPVKTSRSNIADGKEKLTITLTNYNYDCDVTANVKGYMVLIGMSKADNDTIESINIKKVAAGVMP
ncbi:hypothetical protein ACTNBM_02405 [Lachnospiraceae bacterium HCP1S3_C3]|nr:hypothetical protein [Lachnospiraceae bacterium]MDD6856840.1 hypothetical protein [Lachnospiraceae bacterium]